jgi:hypothetical protein
MRFIRVVIVLLAVLMLNAAGSSIAFSAAAPDVGRDYKWIDLSLCKKPQQSPQPLPRESYRTYNIQRRYLDLDQDGVCEVMDVWVERLGEDSSPGMRSLEHNYFRYKGGKWQSVVADLKFYPYALRAIKTKEVIYVEATDAFDIGDDMALATQDISLLVPSGWQSAVPGTLDTLALAPYQGKPGPVLQALAVFLTEQLISAEASPEKHQVPASQIKLQGKAARQKIRWILKEAKPTLSAEEMVPVGSDGIPVLAPR